MIPKSDTNRQASVVAETSVVAGVLFAGLVTISPFTAKACWDCTPGHHDPLADFFMPMIDSSLLPSDQMPPIDPSAFADPDLEITSPNMTERGSGAPPRVVIRRSTTPRAPRQEPRNNAILRTELWSGSLLEGGGTLIELVMLPRTNKPQTSPWAEPKWSPSEGADFDGILTVREHHLNLPLHAVLPETLRQEVALELVCSGCVTPKATTSFSGTAMLALQTHPSPSGSLEQMTVMAGNSTLAAGKMMFEGSQPANAIMQATINSFHLVIDGRTTAFEGDVTLWASAARAVSGMVAAMPMDERSPIGGVTLYFSPGSATLAFGVEN